MEKKLFFKLSDGADYQNIVMELSGCMAWIEGDMENHTDDTDTQYTLTPVWMTDEEFSKLPEHD